MAEAKIVTSTLGWVYVGLAAGWTLLLIIGLAFLYQHRQLPFLQLRRLPLVFVAVILLHLYGALCMVGYTIGAIVPCDAQFWVMSIYLPFGMALLQAANSQFVHVALQQKKFARFNDLEDTHLLSEKAVSIDPSWGWLRRTWAKISNADRTTRIVIYIGFGMAVQLALTLFVYFGSEMFHPGFGLFNVQVPSEQQRKALCFQGWEWWLSIVWQFFWAWVYAPYLLWKTRNIQDAHGWRLQTICCCIAGLPATPLWLAGLYIPEMASVNAVLIPPQWFSFSIFFIEIFTIGFPCMQVIKSHKLRQETLDAIASWESRNKHVSDDETASTSSAGYGSTTLGGTSMAARTKDTKLSESSSESRRSDVFTMCALEHALRSNPQPLLEFAALKDFSGENISFLSHVADWKRAWATSSNAADGKNHKQFIRAVRIYSHFVSLEYSEFPVNISSRGAKELHKIFEKASSMLNRPRSMQSDSATPFEETDSEQPRPSSDLGLEHTLGKANLDAATGLKEMSGDGYSHIPIPDSFTPQVFDAAEKEIKYLVLTNTWPKFVHSGLESVRGSPKEEKKRISWGMLCGFDKLV